MTLRDRIIKLLGGYTWEEYSEVMEAVEALLTNMMEGKK